MADRPSFRDVPKLLTARGSSTWVTMHWHYLPQWLRDRAAMHGVDLNPVFQRGRVWTREQKIRFLEFRLSGGQTGKDVHFNNPSPGNRWDMPLLLMDGKQRIDAVLEFLADELPVFGHTRSEYVDDPDYFHTEFHLYVHNFTDPDDILRWYCDMNRVGVVHSDAEIERVRGLVGKYAELTSPTEERIAELARYKAVGLDDEVRYMAGAHLCGLPGARGELPVASRQGLDRNHARCEACVAELVARLPTRPEPPAAKAKKGGRKRK